MLRAINAIQHELAVAEHQHPGWPVDLLRQMAIVQEEAGEVAKAGLEIVVWSEHGGDSEQMQRLQTALNTELAQLGAMVVRMLEARL